MTGMFFDENTEREILHRSTSKKPFDFSLKGGAWEPALPRKPIHLQRFDGDEVAEEDYEQSPSVIPAPKANPIMKSKVRQPGSSSMGAGGNMGVEPYLARNETLVLVVVVEGLIHLCPEVAAYAATNDDHGDQRSGNYL